MLHIKFHGNRSASSGEEDFQRVSTIYGHGSHLGHVTSIMSSDFHFLVPENIQKKLAQIGKVISEKILFEFLYVHNLGPRSRNDLDLLYSHIFIISISLSSQAAIVSEKSTFFTFSYSKAKVTKFDLAVKYVKVTPGSSFIQTMMGRSPRCYIPSFMEIG